MAHAIRLRIDPANTPDDAQDRWGSVRSSYSEVLSDMVTEFQLIPSPPTAPDEPEHNVAIDRFDDSENRDAIVDEITSSAFPSSKWVVVDVHDCIHDKDGDTCGSWSTAYTRGNPPEPFVI